MTDSTPGRSRPTPAGRGTVAPSASRAVRSHRLGATRRLRRTLPFLFVLAAIVAMAGAGTVYVIDQQHRQLATGTPRNVGVVPTQAGAVAAVLLNPNMIEIPALAAKAPIVTVSTLAGGELDVPANPKTVGWWSAGAKPGAAVGTAVLDGHINFAGVPGVLGRIGTLNPGDIVYVDGIDAGTQTQVKFKITGVQTYSKTSLPYAQIFDQASVGRLAIVTCGGPFNSKTHNYLDNIVAFAVPA